MSNPICSYCGIRVPIPCETKCEERECFVLATKEVLGKPPEAPKLDQVSQPEHYARWKMQPIEYIATNALPFWHANVIKYCARWDAKDGLRDLYKAREYLDMEIRRLEGQPRFWENNRQAPMLGGPAMSQMERAVVNAAQRIASKASITQSPWSNS
jgi:hypothetical protein